MTIHIVKKEFKIILLAIIIGIVSTSFFSLKTYSQETVQNLSDKLVRFRVLANSDKDYDQALKLIVKQSVISHFEKEISNFDSREEALYTFSNFLDEIEIYAQQIVYDYGYNYDVTVKIDYSDFPTRTYGNITLPAGDYTTLVIEIGDARGANWWCVMFPPLCFVDETMESVPDNIDTQIQHTLTQEEYNLVTNNHPEYNIKFKIIEAFN